MTEIAMGVSFDGPPYEPLFAKSASSAHDRGEVTLTIVFELEGLPVEIVRLPIVLEAETARALAGQMGSNAAAAQHWLKTDPRDQVMTTEDSIQTEMRLFALESIVCQHLAGVYQAMPRAIFDEVKKQAVEGAKKQAFPGLGAAYSDLLSAELQTSLERLYGMIQHHLDTAQRRQPK